MSFVEFAEQHGLIIDSLYHDRWVRVPTKDHPHKKNGSYIWDGRRGAVQNWAVHEKPVVFTDTNVAYMPDPQWRAKKEKSERERKLRQNRAIKKAKFILDNAIKAQHPYMESKGFPLDKHWVWNDLLVIPMRINQALVGCQLISQDGTKKFLYGQITKGAEAIIDNKGMHILCEGYATAMSLRRVFRSMGLKYTIHVCFSAANIVEIASHYDQCLIVADNDSVGLNTAKKTGKPFWSSPVDGEDFNDFEKRLGTELAGKEFIEAVKMVA